MATLRIDRFPDELFRRLKSAAALEGIPLRNFVEEMVARALGIKGRGK